MIRKLADPASAVDALVADEELLRVCLAVHRRLDLEGQMEALLAGVVGWCAEAGGVALGPTEDRLGWSLVSSTYAKRDPRRAIVGRTEMAPLRERIEAAEGGAVRVDPGLGPLESVADEWRGELPSWTTTIAIGSASSVRPQGVALVLHDADPPQGWRERLAQLVASIEPAVANAGQVATMRDLVIKDDTAHCYNRRHFESCLPDELARASRFQAALSLIFLDMDNLKQVNQRYGHAMGSRTLFEVSQRIGQKIRRFDKLFRYGGDEFCVVLPETEWPGALEVAERIREAILGQHFLAEALREPGGVPMSASLGIASFPLHAATQAELIERADRAMQKIKNSSKNGVGVAGRDGGDDER